MLLLYVNKIRFQINMSNIIFIPRMSKDFDTRYTPEPDELFGDGFKTLTVSDNTVGS